MKISPERLYPSQNFLKPHTIAFILECLRTGAYDKLPPDPIVRADSEGKLIAIDGHNLIAVKLHRNEDINVHVATSSSDGLPSTTEANIQRNTDLKEKYDRAIIDRNHLHDEGIDTFHDLISRYKNLFQQ